MLPGERRSHVSLGILVSVASLCAAVASSSAQPGPTATASASSPASAAPSGSAAPAGRRVIRGSLIPAGTSDMPKIKEFDDEWSTIGKDVVPTREPGGPCIFTLVREWLRIRCERRIGATMFAGDPADVKILPAGGPLFDEKEPEKNQRVTIFMRVKRGETKLFSLLHFEDGYEWRSLSEHEKISVSWREDQEDPVILVSQF